MHSLGICFDLPSSLLGIRILIAEIMVKNMAEETVLSSLSAGTLAVLVLILVSFTQCFPITLLPTMLMPILFFQVPVLSFLILLFLFVRRHTRSREAEVHCAR